jgi:hypothetical protein
MPRFDAHGRLMFRKLAALTVTCGTAIVLPGGVGAQVEQDLPSAQRPHSRAAVYVHRDVVVRRMLFEGRRRGRRIVGTVGFAVENRSDSDRTVELRVGRCTGGQLSYPTCPSAHRFLVRVPANGRRSAFRHVALRHPPPREDTIELSVTFPGARPPFGTSSHLGNLLLRGRAWRRPASTWYRYDTPRRTTGPEILRGRVDVPRLSSASARPVMSWAAGGSGLLTSTLQACQRIEPCVGALASRTWTTRASFRRRVVVRARGAEGLRLDVTYGDERVLQVVLPWPS